VPLPPKLYDREYFLSDRCEGYEAFEARRGVSRGKARQVALLAPGPGVRILDAGCGRGEVLLACARAGADVAGIDYSEAATEIARETLGGVAGSEIVRGSVTGLPWPHATFDRVLCADVVEHLDPGDARRALREFYRVLRPGGLLLVHTAPNRVFRRLTWPLARPVFLAVGLRANAERVDAWLAEALRYHVNEQTLHGLRRLVRRTGFADVRGWLDADALRGGEHHLTADLGSSRLVSALSELTAWRPLRVLLSNDLYVIGRRP
jgi:ubiquinone/menaquinone biosynthesis C-methylase UbiE